MTLCDMVRMPKVELHTHLDCALSHRAVKALRPDTTLEEYRAQFKAPRRCESLKEFLACIDPSLSILQSKLALTLAAVNLADQLAADNVAYAEVRFAPLLHCREGLRPEEVVEAVLAGLEGAEAPIGLLLCTLRHFDTDQGMATLDLVQRYAGHGVVGLDLAGDERNFPIDPHVSVFQKARRLGVATTAHAGEARGADSVIETIMRLEPSRIGHGVRSIEDPRAVELLLERDIHLEICPSVNIQIGLFPNMEDHSVDRLSKLGVSVGINTDARATTGVTLAQEYEVVAGVFGWDDARFATANLAALNASFAPENACRTAEAALRSWCPQSVTDRHHDGWQGDRT